jgi:hypothetical protein
MAMAPSHLQSAFSRKRDHREAFQPHGLKNYSPNSKTVEPPAKRTQKSTGAANTYTTQVQRVSVKKRKTTYLVRLDLPSVCEVVVVAEITPGVIHRHTRPWIYVSAGRVSGDQGKM